MRTRRRRLPSGDAVSLPHEQQGATFESQQATTSAAPAAQSSTEAARPQTPPAQDKQEDKSAVKTPTASSSSAPRSRAGTVSSVTPVKAAPAVPALPKTLPKASPSDKTKTEDAGEPSPTAKPEAEKQEGSVSDAADTQSETKEASKPAARAPPSSWANLFAKKNAAPTAVDTNGSSPDTATLNGHGSQPASSLFPKSNATNVGEAIRAYQVDSMDKISWIEPRGLINTGNMCYMNSVCANPNPRPIHIVTRANMQ